MGFLNYGHATCPHCGEQHSAETQWECEVRSNGDVPCLDPSGHEWTVSDEDENVCYCSKCGCGEY